MSAHGLGLGIDVRGVHKRFAGVHALRGVDLTFKGGGIYGLVGPNGAGKTTLFSVICGFLGADEGSVSIGGAPVTTGTPPAKGSVAILPQDARFISHMKVIDLLVYYGRLNGLNKAEAKVRAAEVLEMVQLTRAAKQGPETLSHGMRKRVGIAQAFIGKPKLVILDEPTAGLDPHAAREIHGIIRRVRDEQTVIVSSHNLDEIQDLCSQVAILHKGQIVRNEKMEELLGGAGEVSFRMGEPPSDTFTQSLAAMLPWVARAFWDTDAARLRVTFDTNDKSTTEASSLLVAYIVGEGVPFLEMQVGQSLEDRFVAETQ